MYFLFIGYSLVIFKLHCIFIHVLFIRHLNECNECVDYNSQWLMLLFVNIDNKYSVSLFLTHDAMENSTHRKSRRPLTHHAHQLYTIVSSRDSETLDTNKGGLSRGHPPPRDCGHGVGLSRRAWSLRLESVDLAQTCCAGDCLRVTAVILVPNKRQNTSLVDTVPSTAHLRGSMDSLSWTI